ncbi:MAG: hypothetical protein IJ194_06525 [Bacilli bacterium]|nr:hypothetical protein [Bacilli bacterium]
MQKAVEAYQAYATSYSSRYVDLRLGRAGDFHINDVFKMIFLPSTSGHQETTTNLNQMKEQPARIALF